MPVSCLILPFLFSFFNNFTGGGGQDTIILHTNPSPEVYVYHKIQSDKSHQGVKVNEAKTMVTRFVLSSCFMKLKNISDVLCTAM